MHVLDRQIIRSVAHVIHSIRETKMYLEGAEWMVSDEEGSGWLECLWRRAELGIGGFGGGESVWLGLSVFEVFWELAKGLLLVIPDAALRACLEGIGDRSGKVSCSGYKKGFTGTLDEGKGERS